MRIDSGGDEEPIARCFDVSFAAALDETGDVSPFGATVVDKEITMNKKRAVRVFSGAAATIVGGALFLAASGMSHGLDSGVLKATPANSAAHTQPRVDVAQADAAPAEMPVTFASEQADRGEKRFDDNCADCHGEDLRGGLLGGPPLRGVNFEAKYANGAPAGVLFEVMSGTMPPNAPGRFSAAQYAELMAYILKRNGFKTGAALPSDVDALYNLTMVK